MLRKRQQQRNPSSALAPDAPSTSTPTSGEEQREPAVISGRPSSCSKGPDTSSSTGADAAAVHRRHEHKGKMESSLASENSPLLGGAGRETTDESGSAASTKTMTWSQRNQWVIFAIASGTCAALNGVMAKLTTTELTTSLSHQMAAFLGLSTAEGAVEFVVRATFFGLNLAFNGVMWTLFTQALSRGHSTTQVSIMNTSANFVLTALLGLVIFSESLPPLWWLGASMLVAGNVIIGRKDEGSTDSDGDRDVVDADVDAISEAESGRSDYEPPIPQADGTVAPPIEKDDEEDDIPLLGNLDPDQR